MRYHGQGHEIEITLPSRDLSPGDLPALRQAFEREYARQFSRVIPEMTVEILNWSLSLAVPTQTAKQAQAIATKGDPETRQIHCDVTGTTVTAMLHDRATLAPHAEISGPALITEPQTTTFVSADFTACVDNHGNLWLTRKEAP